MKEFWRNLYEIEDEKIKEIEKKSSWIRKKKLKQTKSTMIVMILNTKE